MGSVPAHVGHSACVHATCCELRAVRAKLAGPETPGIVTARIQSDSERALIALAMGRPGSDRMPRPEFPPGAVHLIC